jgi:hypothetical protein
VGIRVYAESSDGTWVRDLEDPNGGRFDAAGDFDQVLAGLDDDYPRLRAIDPDSVALIPRNRSPELHDELTRLLGTDLRPIERRGLNRLLALVSLAVGDSSITLMAEGN